MASGPMVTVSAVFVLTWRQDIYTGCFKKSFTTLKAYRNLGVFRYILTVQNLVYVLCINFYKLTKLKRSF
jgi:hypothetical protein